MSGGAGPRITLRAPSLFSVFNILPDLLLTNSCKSDRALACVEKINSISNISLDKHSLKLIALRVPVNGQCCRLVHTLKARTSR